MAGIFEILKIIILGIFLIAEGVRDLKKHRISMLSVMIAGVIGFILCALFIKDNIMSVLGGILIGVVMLLLAKFTEEKIGYGDGWVFMVTGIYLGLRANLYLLFVSLFLSAVVSMILLICKKAEYKTELPFVPFVLPGYLFLMVAQ